jgi:hypothetical protein
LNKYLLCLQIILSKENLQQNLGIQGYLLYHAQLEGIMLSLLYVIWVQVLVTVQNTVRSLSRVPDEIGTIRTEPAHTIYRGSSLQRVIPYILLLLIIHGDGVPRAREYNGEGWLLPRVLFF